MTVCIHPLVLAIPFFFWAIVLFASVIFDKEGYKVEGKPRWKVALMASAFVVIGVLLLL